MRPGGRPERMIVPEHRSGIRIHPISVADKFRCHDIADRMIILQRSHKRDRIALDLLNPNDFRTTPITLQRCRRIVVRL